MANKKASPQRQQDGSQGSQRSAPIVADNDPKVKRIAVATPSEARPARTDFPNPSAALPEPAKRVSGALNAIQSLRIDRKIAVSDMVDTVRTIYPSYDRQLHSKVEHGDRYGIRLQGDAERLLLRRYSTQNVPKTEQRKKRHRVQARLSEAVFGALQRLVRESGQTMQDYLEKIIIEHIERSKS